MRTLLRTLPCAAVAAALLLPSAGCQPLYGGKAEKLKVPEKRKRPKETAESGPTIVYNEECKADFFATGLKVTAMPSLADQQVQLGNAAMDASRRAAVPEAKVSSIIEAINKYKAALSKDPFSADATLQLAVAYDSVLKKGCAIELLKRLAALQTYPSSADIARVKLDEIVSREAMFKGYRNDAMKAIGR